MKDRKTHGRSINKKAKVESSRQFDSNASSEEHAEMGSSAGNNQSLNIQRRRLISLGAGVVAISLLGLLLIEEDTLLAEYLPGTTTMTCGVFIFVIVLKLHNSLQPGLWYFIGPLHAAPAIVLMNDPRLLHWELSILLVVLMIISAGITLAIGICSVDKTTKDWFCAAGFTCLLMTLIFLVDSMSYQLLQPELVLIAFSLLTGLAIIGMAKNYGTNGNDASHSGFN